MIAPGRAPDHSHVYDEVIYVLEGAGRCISTESTSPSQPARASISRRCVEHSLENSGDTPMKVVAVFHPAGDPASRAYEANE